MENTNNIQNIRKHILAQGQVQGVGFRPFIYRLALDYKLSGHVSNTAEGVSIEIQGLAQNVDLFIYALKHKLPPLAKLTQCIINEIELISEDKFKIIQSHASQAGHNVLISPDIGICSACEADMEDTKNRRYLYPFTNCTNCGPRYTITHSIPYDRCTTSMACFPLCKDCQDEYDNPLDRRFHAQPNACPICGPRIWYIDKTSEHSTELDNNIQGEEALKCLCTALLQGKMAAIKGLGGFHLACFAFALDSIELLRLRKNRPHKPLAIMVDSIKSARQIATLSPAEEALLLSKEKPIVLCQDKGILPRSLAPDTNTIGIMLAYTPFHKALFKHLQDALLTSNHKEQIPALVMTSANDGGEPICLGNREAFNKLQEIADVFLFHNRDILVRTDDSVCKVQSEPEQIVYIRRARGFVPSPIEFSKEKNEQMPVILGMGAELKNTICLSRQNMAFVSQHIGDLQNLATLAFYHEVINHLKMLLQVKPQVIVHDAHPDFLSTHVAKELAKKHDLQCIALQHHYAHAYAVLAEHQVTEPCLALSLDGTGLGDDGSIWGGELLCLHGAKHYRLGRLAPFSLIGGEMAIKEPWRIALALAANTHLEQEIAKNRPMSSALLEMLAKNIQAMPCSSLGRLFDAISAALNLGDSITYEGQAAIRLEFAQKGFSGQIIDNFNFLPYRKNNLWELPTQELFIHILEEYKEHGLAHAAYSFHIHIAQGFTQMVKMAVEELAKGEKQIKNIAISGGVLHNETLYTELYKNLKGLGLEVISSKSLPPNDANISLGQA